jgi:hypothetical protein
MAAVAVSLGVMSYLHLGGSLGQDGSPPFSADPAGIAEALIGVVLLVGAAVVLLRPERARTVATAVTVFAIAGFVLGLTITISGGDAVDIAYHSTVLPILLGILVLVRRTGEFSPPGRASVASRR